ncbi:uncharacterized protein LOC119743535 [Patiria miniata]|uniref:Farnesoic acid O-methyl transferase domain-containing protein n=1 Tax=Patiria miniata TaxID=46514 RepID=A0A914BJ77_PATMI|nr:uncharacterized protein LOC119743535 [Patiria miniata]
MAERRLVLAVVFVGSFAVMVADGMVCYLGNEPDSNGTVQWVLPYRDPCECKEIRLGSFNTRAPSRPFTPTYFNLTAVAVGDLNAVLKLVDCKPGCHIFETSGYVYNYKFAALPRSTDGGVLVRFAVRVDYDVHIALTGQNADSLKMYEIIIGGWTDTKSAIRRKKQGTALTTRYESAGWLDGQTYMDFWVSASPGTGTADLTIAVGRGSDTAPFMSYVDSSPLPVTHLGFSLWGSSLVGQFKFCGLNLVSDS